MSNVRPLQRDDFEWIMDELRDLPRQSELFADCPQDHDHVSRQFNGMWEAGVFGGVVHPQTASFLLFVQTIPWYANRLEIHEMLLWVPERHRGSRVAYGLIREFTKAALDLGPHSIHAGHTLDITDKERTLGLYDRVGYARHAGGVIMRP